MADRCTGVAGEWIAEVAEVFVAEGGQRQPAPLGRAGRLRTDEGGACPTGLTTTERYFVYLSSRRVHVRYLSSQRWQLLHPPWVRVLTNHGKTLLLIAEDSRIRTRDLARLLEITERASQGIVADLANAGYIEREREGRRNRYTVSTHLPLGLPIRRDADVQSRLSILQTTNGSE